MNLKPLLLLSTLLFIIHVTPAIGEYVGLGNCPNPTAVAGTLNGVWFEQRRYDSVFSHSLRCPRYTFAPNNGALTSLNINAIYKVTGRAFNINARLIPTPTGSTSTYAVEYNNLNFFQQNFRIIGITAGVSAVLFSCQSIGLVYLAQVIVLTAAQIPNPTDLNNALNVVRTANLPTWLLRTTDQTLC